MRQEAPVVTGRAERQKNGRDVYRRSRRACRTSAAFAASGGQSETVGCLDHMVNRWPSTREGARLAPTSFQLVGSTLNPLSRSEQQYVPVKVLL